MNKYLLHYCAKQGSKNCHPKVRDLLLPQEIEEYDKIPLWPDGSDQKELDEICEHCTEAVFEIEERKCPVCLSTRLDVPFFKGGTANSIEIFNYKCEDCGRDLFSHKELK